MLIFRMSDPTTCVFLHHASTVADLNEGKLDPTLLKALCASGLSLLLTTPDVMQLDGDMPSAEPLQLLPETWMRQVQATVLSRVGRQSVADLQALILLIPFLLDETDAIGDGLVLLGLAARIALLQGLNRERGISASVPQGEPALVESQRRLIWAIYLLDRRCCGGIENLSVWSGKGVQLRLPCDDHHFRLGLPSRAPFLYEPQPPGQALDGRDSEMWILGHTIRLMDIRDQILRLVDLWDLCERHPPSPTFQTISLSPTTDQRLTHSGKVYEMGH